MSEIDGHTNSIGNNVSIARLSLFDRVFEDPLIKEITYNPEWPYDILDKQIGGQADIDLKWISHDINPINQNKNCWKFKLFPYVNKPTEYRRGFVLDTSYGGIIIIDRYDNTDQFHEYISFWPKYLAPIQRFLGADQSLSMDVLHRLLITIPPIGERINNLLREVCNINVSAMVEDDLIKIGYVKKNKE